MLIETRNPAQEFLSWANRNTIQTDRGDKIWNPQYGQLASVTRAWDQFDNKNKDYWVKNIGDDNYKNYLKPAARLVGVLVATRGAGYLFGGTSTVGTMTTNLLKTWLPINEGLTLTLNSADKYWTTGKAPTFPELTSWGLEAAGDAVLFSSAETAFTAVKTASIAYTSSKISRYKVFSQMDKLDPLVSKITPVSQKFYRPIANDFTQGRITTAVDTSRIFARNAGIVSLAKGYTRPVTTKITDFTGSIRQSIPKLSLPRISTPKSIDDFMYHNTYKSGVHGMLRSTEGSLNISSLIPDLDRLSNGVKWAGTKISSLDKPYRYLADNNPVSLTKLTKVGGEFKSQILNKLQNSSFNQKIIKPSYEYLGGKNPVSWTKLGEFKSTVLNNPKILKATDFYNKLPQQGFKGKLLYYGIKSPKLLYQGGKGIGNFYVTEYVPRLWFYGTTLGTIDAYLFFDENKFKATGQLPWNLRGFRATELNFGLQVKAALTWDSDKAADRNGLATAMSQISTGGQVRKELLPVVRSIR
ncbi:MAG TPA: hypothetical protein DHV62_10930, partial [Elusimicrobia bacterium]|nr:hypothetical protein [Elusimicrobiota bacterium]